MLSQDEVDDRLRGLGPGWSGDPHQLSRSIEFADFATAVQFVNDLAPICERLDHHPDLALRWRWVDVVLTTHSAGGVTDQDVTLANAIDEVAAVLPRAE